MAFVKIITVFEGMRQAREKKTISTREGKEMTFQAEAERTIKCALVEAGDGSGARVQVELPAYHKEIKVGDSIQVEGLDMDAFDKIWSIRNIIRYIPASTGK